MNSRINKLMNQVHDGIKTKSNLFNGISIYVNGYTSIVKKNLKILIFRSTRIRVASFNCRKWGCLSSLLFVWKNDLYGGNKFGEI